MQNAWNEIVTFFRMMEQNGAYYGIGLLAVLFCLMYKGADKKKNIVIALGGCLMAVALCNPVTVLLYEKIFGDTGALAVLTPAIPLFVLVSYVGTEIFVAVSVGRRCREKWFIAVVLGMVIMVAGTVVPWSDREDLAKRAEMPYDKDEPMMAAVQDAAAELTEAGQGPLLVAPKEIMESVRRYNPQICLVYGKDLWQADALPYLHESYPAEKIILCQEMESPEANVAQTVELALAQGCNLIVCREALPESFSEYHQLELYAQAEELYLYVR